MGERVGGRIKEMKKFICKHPWSHFEINNPNGDVTMCCNNNTVLGNVNSNEVSEIWNGKKFQAVRSRMINEGAYSMCPHTCPVLQGGKTYENLDWYRELSEDSEQRLNAELNELEFKRKSIILDSLPRWFRFTYSYACNLDCYHCYQREDATLRIKLPKRFMEDVPKYAKVAQMVYPFGGEPFYFSPVVEFLESHNSNLETRFFFITNGTLLSDRVYSVLERLTISCMAVSLDAASEDTFDKLRVRGRRASWSKVLENLSRIQELKSKKGFDFKLSMTLNSENCHQIEKFVNLALSYGAEPLIMLVANPYQTVEFQKQYLSFNQQQFKMIETGVRNALPAVQKLKYVDAELYLNELLKHLKYHKGADNNVARFRAKKAARNIYHRLPEYLQIPVRNWVQRSRTRRLAKIADEE